MTRGKQIEKVTEFFTVRKNTMINKGADYATETDVLSNFKYSGNIIGLSKEMQILSLIATKVSRLGNLLNSGNTPNNESIDDSILDLGCYTDLLYCARKEDEGKTTQKGILSQMMQDDEKDGFYLPGDEKCDCDPNNPPTYKPYYEPTLNIGDIFRYKNEGLRYTIYDIDADSYYFQSKAIKRQVSKEEFNNSLDWTKL